MFRIMGLAGTASLVALSVPAHAQQGDEPALPAVAAEPMAQQAGDPLLSLADRAGHRGEFRAAVAGAVARNARVRGADAMVDAADAVRDEAWMGYVPDVQVGLQARRQIARKFSGQIGTQYEQTLSRDRTDASFSVRQTFFDFGATTFRIYAAGNRLRAAAANLDSTRDQVALAVIGAWYDVFAYRTLLALSDDFIAEQSGFLTDLETRIAQGVAAEGDIARVRSSLALARSNRARYARQAATAEAMYEEMTGLPAPAGLQRAPEPAAPAVTAEMAAYLARRSPAVQSAEAQARAARRDAQAAKSDRYPTFDGGIEGGRYGIAEDRYHGDYDIRATFNIRQSFFTGTIPRARQASAQARAAAAQAEAISDEAARKAAVAWADLEGLDAELAALSENYIASRQTRDVLAERFRASRGDLFDVMRAQDTFFSIAARYVEVLSERDAARYALLARTGRLSDALGLEQALPAMADDGDASDGNWSPDL
ncbi:TolC family protein [Croceicoccus mobilis]|nr:TolC family protein [Croceicoccus mobilis]